MAKSIVMLFSAVLVVVGIIGFVNDPVLGLFEVNEAAEVVKETAHPDANIIFGATIDDSLGDEVRITVIAAGFDRSGESRPITRRTEPTLGLTDNATRPSFDDGENDDAGDDDFDVPEFLR